MQRIRKILIVGGGIAGLSAAIAARQAGVEVDLVEADPAWATVGVGLTLQPSALRAVKQLGVLDQVLACGFGYDGTCTVDAQGRVSSEVAEGPRLAGPQYPSAAGAPRPALAAILKARAAELGAAARAGVTVAGLGLGPSRTDVRFSDGGRGQYDLVVGADGIYSSVRRMVFDFTLAPEFTGQGVWRFTIARLPQVERAWLCRGGPHSAGLIPLTHDLMYLFLVENGVEDGRRIPREALAPALAGLLSGFRGVFGELAAQLGPDSDVVYRPFEWVIAPAPWHRKRVLLIGDAAHASTAHLGAGGGMAIEDAIVLADELARAATPEAAFRAYRDRRFERCALTVRMSRAICDAQLGKGPPVDQASLTGRLFELMSSPL